MNPHKISGLYLIIDHPFLRGRLPEKICEEALFSGVKIIQFRAKNLSGREAFDLASRIQGVTAKKGGLFIVNDRVDLAMAVGADGVHLGQADFPPAKAREILGPGKVIGVSAHTVSQAREAEKSGADYVGAGPVFASKTKQARPPLGCARLRKIRESVDIPVVPIGGITPENIGEVLETGVNSFAVVSAVLSRDDLRTPILEFQSAFENFPGRN